MPLSTTKYVWPSINEFSGLFDLSKKGYVFILTLTLSDLKSRIDLWIKFKSKLNIEINIFANLSTKSIKAIFVIFKNHRKIAHWVSNKNSGRPCPGWNRGDVQRKDCIKMDAGYSSIIIYIFHLIIFLPKITIFRSKNLINYRLKYSLSESGFNFSKNCH